MNVIASKIWNYSNCIKVVFNVNKNLYFLAVTNDILLNQQNNECE